MHTLNPSLSLLLFTGKATLVKMGYVQGSLLEEQKHPQTDYEDGKRPAV